MAVCTFPRWPVLVLIFLSLTAVSAFGQSGVDVTAEGRACDDYRREMASLFHRAFENKAGPKFLTKFIPKWVELSLPANCGKPGRASTDLNPSLSQSSGRPLETRSEPRPVVAKNANEMSQRRGENGKHAMDVPRAKRAASDWANNELDAILRERRGAKENGKDVLVREKRFLGIAPGVPDFSAMTLGSSNLGGPAREVSESAQMMNNLLMFSKYQKNNLAREYSTIGRQGSRYVGDRVSFGSGIYGDVYPGRRKREASNKASSPVLTKANSRKKRFLYVGEPAEGAGTSSLFSILLGQEPNKRSELSRDFMNRAMGNTLMSFLPPGMHPPVGKDPGDFLKSMAPLFQVPNTSSPGSFKKRNGNGLFGDSLPGKKRRKRSSRKTTLNYLMI